MTCRIFLPWLHCRASCLTCRWFGLKSWNPLEGVMTFFPWFYWFLDGHTWSLTSSFLGQSGRFCPHKTMGFSWWAGLTSRLFNRCSRFTGPIDIFWRLFDPIESSCLPTRFWISSFETWSDFVLIPQWLPQGSLACLDTPTERLW